MKRTSLILSVFFLLLVLVLLPIISGCAKPAPAPTPTPTPAPTPTPTPTPTPAPPKTLKIGLITSVTGVMSATFKSIYDAAQPTADLLNQMGGITVNGQKYNIEIVALDDQSSPDGAVAAAQKLIQDGIKFMVAPQFIPMNMAIAPITEQAKVIRMSPIIIDPALFGPQYNYHFCSYMTLYNVPPMYDWVEKNYPQVKKMAIIMGDDPGGYAARDYTVKEIEKHGMQLVFNDVYNVATADFYPIVTKALAQKPDAIELVLGIVPWDKGIMGTAREMGFNGPIFCSAPFGDINLLNSLLDPKYTHDIFHGGPDVLSDKMTPLVQDLRKLVEQETNAPFILDSTLPLGALWPLVQAIEKAQSFDADTIVNTFHTMESIDTIYGKGKITGEDLVGINNVILGPIPFSRLVDGKVEAGWLQP